MLLVQEILRALKSMTLSELQGFASDIISHPEPSIEEKDNGRTG